VPKYKPTEAMHKDLQNRFLYHPPQDDQAERYGTLRRQAFLLACNLTELCPPSRELSLALTHLEECVMFGNAAIARNEETIVAEAEKGG